MTEAYTIRRPHNRQEGRPTVLKLRFCKQCAKALETVPADSHTGVMVRALCEVGRWVCPWSKPECGKFIGADGRPCNVQPIAEG